MNMDRVIVRPFAPGDREAIRKICRETGLKGDPTRLFFEDEEVLPLLYVDYYLDHEPDACFVAESAGRVVGYQIGSLDARRRRRIMLIRVYPRVALRILSKASDPSIPPEGNLPDPLVDSDPFLARSPARPPRTNTPPMPTSTWQKTTVDGLRELRRNDEIALDRLGVDHLRLDYHDGAFRQRFPLLRYGIHLRVDVSDFFENKVAAILDYRPQARLFFRNEETLRRSLTQYSQKIGGSAGQYLECTWIRRN